MELNTNQRNINQEVVSILTRGKKEIEAAFAGTIKEGCERRYTIINERDLNKYVNDTTRNELEAALESVGDQIENGRINEGKPAFNNYVVVNIDEPYIKDVVAVLEENGHWDGQPSFKMKFYEVHYPYYALIMATNEDEAIEIYTDNVAEDYEGDLIDEIQEVSRDYAVIRFSRTKSEDGEEIDQVEVLATLNSEDSQVLVIDGALL